MIYFCDDFAAKCVLLEFINVAICEFHSVIASSVILLITFVRMELKYALFRYILSLSSEICKVAHKHADFLHPALLL